MAENQLFQWRTVTGEAVTAGGRTIRPQSRALTVRWPGGGFVWNRPVALLVQQGEDSERIPIVDLTRMTQWGLAGVGLIFSVLALVVSFRERSAR
jgi:hypothetical protein